MSQSSSRPVALVTGGGTGVGRATSELLAGRGFAVAINYSRSQAEAAETCAGIEAAGGEAMIVQADVADREQVAAMVSAVTERWGRLDVVVNNAGTTHFIELGDLASVDEGVWDDILSVNLKGAFWVVQQAEQWLRQSPQGAVVNVASMAGVTGAGSSLPYSASKGAMITMTKSLARGLAPAVRVNAVCPGVIESRWLAEHRDMIDAALKVTPLGRASDPADIAKAIVYLACDAPMTTGQYLQIDGGRTI